MGKAPYYYTGRVTIYDAYGEGKLPSLQTEIRDNDGNVIFLFSEKTPVSANSYLRHIFRAIMHQSDHTEIFDAIGVFKQFVYNVKLAYNAYWDELDSLPASYFTW